MIGNNVTYVIREKYLTKKKSGKSKTEVVMNSKGKKTLEVLKKILIILLILAQIFKPLYPEQ